ncbi:hypothetical protein DM02DRAFT_607896, partial [Periconia macrospinosa]
MALVKRENELAMARMNGSTQFANRRPSHRVDKPLLGSGRAKAPPILPFLLHSLQGNLDNVHHSTTHYPTQASTYHHYRFHAVCGMSHTERKGEVICAHTRTHPTPQSTPLQSLSHIKGREANARMNDKQRGLRTSDSCCASSNKSFIFVEQNSYCLEYEGDSHILPLTMTYQRWKQSRWLGGKG